MDFLGITREVYWQQRRLDEGDEGTRAMKGENTIENVLKGTVGMKMI
jgi:hypothetical protein